MNITWELKLSRGVGEDVVAYSVSDCAAHVL